MPEALHFSSNRAPTAVLRVTGEDAFSFLQGQFSNDLNCPPGSSTYGLWLNQKGRVVADSTVLRLAESEFLIVSARSPVGCIRQRLEDYIVADDVILTDESAQMGGLTLWGAAGGEILGVRLGMVPTCGRFARGETVLASVANHLPEGFFEILGPAAALADWEEKLVAAGGVAQGVEFLERVRIAAGIPAIPEDLGPADLPNEGGLETSAISYTKGCYLGQEIMARLKNLGQVRRRLFVVHGSGAPPQPQAALFQEEKIVGQIRSVAACGTGFVALAMLSLAHLDTQRRLGLTKDGPTSVGFGGA